MKVRVQNGMKGFYDNVRRHEGDVFTIPDEPRKPVSPDQVRKEPVLGKIMDKASTVPRMFSCIWMEPVPSATPDKVSTAQQQINKKHDEELAARMEESATDETGDAVTEDPDVI